MDQNTQDRAKARRAVISVSDKTGVVDFARGLVERGFEIVSTGGTARALEAAGVPVTTVSDVTHFPEMLDGRVKTLHPAVHGGILARRDHSDDMEAIGSHGINPIDIVVVNLYPFVKTAADPAKKFDDLIEDIDIGGPTLLRAAAKNFRFVLAVVDPADYPQVLTELDQTTGPSQGFRFELAQKTFAHTAAYDSAIAGELISSVRIEDGEFQRIPPDGGLPNHLSLHLVSAQSLRYGENPHQAAKRFGHIGAGPAFAQLQGKPLSFTNLLDLDAAHRIVYEFAEPAAAVVKHTIPCGVANAIDLSTAYLLARDADRKSAFGGIVGLNRRIDVETAMNIVRTFIECVIAPAVDEDALKVLATKNDLRVIVAKPPTNAWDIRSVFGDILVQERDRVSEADEPWDQHRPDLLVVTKRPPTAEEWIALRFSWRVCAHVRSNAVIYTWPQQTAGIGAGQTNRHASALIGGGALSQQVGSRAGLALVGTVAASDAFFPFRDGLDVVAAAGATAVVQPGGSVRDPEVIAAADEHKMAMVFTKRRHFRH